MTRNDVPEAIISRFYEGLVIPAMPLALTADRRFDEKHQRAILRYYVDAGAGGVAVGVHSTQFEIRDPGIDLFEPALEFASSAVDDWAERRGAAVLKIAGAAGKTVQAVREAETARDMGYHACLVSLAALPDADTDGLVAHCLAVSEVLPVVGFYLQPAVGGRVLPYAFWRRFAEIDNVIGIKIAPFNRYQTLDVVRAVVDSGRADRIALYTGNDDTIVADLLTAFDFGGGSGEPAQPVRIKGGLLGHWGFWTRKAVELLQRIHSVVEADDGIPADLMKTAAQVTDVNAAVFDPAHHFKGCISGIHEMLRRQGLLAGIWCLSSDERLSEGQIDEIDRVCRAYPHLNDDLFVSEHLDEWLA